MPANPFIGQLMPVPYNFAPQGWALCNGQLLSIAQNTALFSLLGTTYGGDGQTTCALSLVQRDPTLQVGQSESGLAVATVGRTEQREQRRILGDRQELAVA